MNHKLLRATGSFFRCPNDGRILAAVMANHDDKVLCGCGKSNPAGKGGLGHRPFTEPRGTHIKRFLVTATADDYIAQEGS